MKYLKTFEIKSGAEILKLSVVDIKGKVFVEIGPRYRGKNDVCTEKPLLLSFIDYCRVAYRVEAVGKVFNKYFKETT